MCLLVIAWRSHPLYRLVVAANRDEFHERPAAALARWPSPDMLAGRDLRAGGTWLGLDRARRFGVVTNFRDLQAPQPHAPSRGALIPEYLGGALPPSQFFVALAPRAPTYSGFNLLLADQESLWYGANRAQPFARELPPGVYGLSNGLLDTPWPKLERVRRGFRGWLEPRGSTTPGELFQLLEDRTRVSEEALTQANGLAREWERALSAPFVEHPDYGTRASTVLLLKADGGAYIGERRFDAQGRRASETEFHLNPGEWL